MAIRVAVEGQTDGWCEVLGTLVRRSHVSAVERQGNKLVLYMSGGQYIQMNLGGATAQRSDLDRAYHNALVSLGIADE